MAKSKFWKISPSPNLDNKSLYNESLSQSQNFGESVQVPIRIQDFRKKHSSPNLNQKFEKIGLYPDHYIKILKNQSKAKSK